MNSSSQDKLNNESHKRALYAALKAHDARFDGQVFVGVSSTGIYCRPICRVKVPKYENCTFFATAAEAEQAGYRPCLLCRPEIAPGASIADASANLSRRAATLIRENCTRPQGVEQLAARLGYTDRHLRRVFEEEFAVSPAQYLQTCRLHLAKSLLTESNLSVSAVARASGFGSTRRFNDVFKRHYRMTPSELRKHKGTRKPIDEGIVFRLGYRPPYRFDDLLAFFRMRQIEGVERIDDSSYERAVRLEDEGTEHIGWLRVKNDEKKNALIVIMSESLLPVTSQVLERVRHMFDIDSDPSTIHEAIASLDEIIPGAAKPGTRVPGCFDPFETAVRAILGQQVTVAFANTLAARVARSFGTPIELGRDGLSYAFPTHHDILAIPVIEDAFGELGVIKTRSRVIAEIAHALDTGDIDFGRGAIVDEQREKLLALKGIGPWTADYMALRIFGHPDVFLEGDAGIKHALPDTTPKERLALAEQWRPWRSYANLCLWNSLNSSSKKED
ncbi:MAG: AlkA N-terminal domain-containing protein [Coriobacteriales bacterium]